MNRIEFFRQPQSAIERCRKRLERLEYLLEQFSDIALPNRYSEARFVKEFNSYIDSLDWSYDGKERIELILNLSEGVQPIKAAKFLNKWLRNGWFNGYEFGPGNPLESNRFSHSVDIDGITVKLALPMK